MVVENPAFVAMSTKPNRGNTTAEEREENRKKAELEQSASMPLPLSLSPDYQERRELFCSKCEHMHKRGCCDECKKAGKKIGAMEKCPDGKWTKYCARIKCNAMLPRSVINSKGFNSLLHLASRRGITIDAQRTTIDYTNRLRGTRSAITWGMKKPHGWYLANCKNPLFIENGLLKQSKGCFIDAGGFFADSNLCKNREWEQTPTPAEVENLKKVVKNRFGWELFQGGSDRGPIIITLQLPSDAPLKYYYPAADGYQDKNRATLQMIANNLKSRKRVIVRPHPRDTNLDRLKYEDLFKANWSWDDSPDIYKTLPECSALITANSTTAIEALTLGIPVATLGDHVWTDADVVFECAGQPTLLDDFKVVARNGSAEIAFLCAVLRHELGYFADPKSVEGIAELQEWIQRETQRFIHAVCGVQWV